MKYEGRTLTEQKADAQEWAKLPRTKNSLGRAISLAGATVLMVLALILACSEIKTECKLHNPAVPAFVCSVL